MKTNLGEKWHALPLYAQYSILIVIGLIVGVTLFSGKGTVAIDASANKEVQQEQIWTCSMHPQIQLPKPGKCPICAMDLIPLESETSDASMPSKRSIKLSEYAKQLAEIEVHPVERKFVTKEVELFGEVDYDETRIAYITAWVSGRIDRLYIDETGVPARKGDHIAYLYSPELLSAQQEYLQALEGDDKVKESHLDIIRSSSKDTIKNARDKLLLLGVTEEQIRSLETEKEAREHITIFSPASGIVLKREVEEGDYVKTGERLYSIADLEHLWIRLDAYESDIEWLRHGQTVTFNVEAYPGRAFDGRITFISPVLDKTTRTVKIRVAVDNQEGKLKPGMFVSALVKSEIAAEGLVVDEYMIDKWLCPMHPSVVKDAQGTCPVCFMDLVSSEEMGYTKPDAVAPPLVVKASAVLKTGKRAVVYVQDIASDEPMFEGREIALGPRAGDYYLVLSGLSEGDMVVTQGNFKLDSALQIQAKPSMMSPTGNNAAMAGHNHGHAMESSQMDASPAEKQEIPALFLEQLNAVYESYFVFQESLAQDEFSAAQKALHEISNTLPSVDMMLLKGDSHAQWMELSQKLQNGVAIVNTVKDIADMRKTALNEIASIMLQIETYFGHSGEKTYYQAFCPMAMDNKGAAWLQRSEPINNPFYGKMMQRCGEVQKTFSASEEQESSTGGHDGH